MARPRAGFDAAALLRGLNPEQRRAVGITDGPALVLAGAGTGKTRVVTARIARLLADGAEPEQILAVTFTNKAAREMRERVESMVGASARALTIGTFHAFCARLLREHARRLGLAKNFPICDSADQIAAVRAALRECSVPETALHPRAAQAKISLWKSRLVAPRAAAQESDDPRDALAATAYAAYERELARRRMLDFDDLLLRALGLLREHEEVRAALEDRFRWLMVDEYQDTNRPQYEIVRLIAGQRRNLMVVGDDDQSIYAWRGADHRRILEFERDFPGAAVVRLETNYRSSEEILDAANKVIRNNAARHAKSLRAALGAGESVQAFACEDEEHEAQFVVAAIADLVRRGELRPRDCAILFRTQTQPRPFETELRTHGIPVRVSGAQSFYDRKEIRDLTAFLRLVARPHDESALLRVVNVPPRGIGATTVERAVERAAAEGRDAARVLADAAAQGTLPPAAARGWAALQSALAQARVAVRAGDALPQVVGALIDAVGYRGEVERCYPERGAQELRWNGALEILDAAAAHARHHGAQAGLDSFLDEMSLRSGEENASAEEQEPADAVTLSTIHAAKGLEFERVWLVGCEEGILPHRRAALEGGIEEERRLMYVAVTRAKRALAITFCRQRALRGRLAPRFPSRFLLELKEKPPPAGWMACDSEEPAPAPQAAVQPSSPRPAKKARASERRPRKTRTDSSTGRDPPGS
jgi:DNA helicase-2/ATP-dependent DNA helicase PcrA